MFMMNMQMRANSAPVRFILSVKARGLFKRWG
jgi:hypothetical protein